MSKQEALLETLLGAAELSGNRIIAGKIRDDLCKMRRHEVEGYRRLQRAASEQRRPHSKAA